MTAPGGNAIDSDMAVLFTGPLGMAMCAKKIYGWFKEGRGPQQTLDTGHEVYSEISKGQVDVSDLINKVIRDSGASWSGAAGDQMRGSTSPLSSWADTAGSTATAGASTVATLSSAYRTAQNSVQQPVAVPDKPWYNDHVPWDTDYDEALGKSQGVDSANMQVLNTYAETATAATSSSPKFESPNSSTATVQETPPSQIDQPKSYDGYNRQTSTSSVATTPTPLAATPPGGTTTPSWTAPPAAVQNTPNVPNTPPGGNLNQPGVPLPGLPLPGGPLPGGSTSTPRPGGLAGRPGGLGGPGGQSRAPGGPSGPGGPGAGAAGAARGTGGVGGGGLGSTAKPGGFGPLGSGGAAGVLGEQGRGGAFGPSGSGNTGAAGARGAAGMAGGGAAAGAGRGEGADDLEHTTKYVEPNDEAFGDDRVVAPPVIGG
ncbi:hypothetical protein [Lentzea sp. NPDC004782]|uniref:hypothetical protein n=1 Tax=Lentzea sp. NPDC004782 TaxID=3154458 RepID=UPI0033A52741